MDLLGGFGQAAIVVGLVALAGIVIFLVLGYPLLRKLGDKVTGLFWPADQSFRFVPEYSVAEARVKGGQYNEAVREFHKVLRKFPDDVHAHVRIADLCIAHLHQPKLAELELREALTKEKGWLIAAHRLADLYLQTYHDPQQALAVLGELRDKYPGTNEARRAAERIVALQKTDGNPAPPPPVKIAFKPTNEETLRRRRGY